MFSDLQRRVFLAVIVVFLIVNAILVPLATRPPSTSFDLEMVEVREQTRRSDLAEDRSAARTALENGHELGAHGFSHLALSEMTAAEREHWFRAIMVSDEELGLSANQWFEPLSSLAYPYSKGGSYAAEAANYGFVIAGNKIPAEAVMDPLNTTEADWFQIPRSGGKLTLGETSSTEVEDILEVGGLVDFMFHHGNHRGDLLDPEVLDLMRNQTSHWLATWGEVGWYQKMAREGSIVREGNMMRFNWEGVEGVEVPVTIRCRGVLAPDPSWPDTDLTGQQKLGTGWSRAGLDTLLTVKPDVDIRVGPGPCAVEPWFNGLRGAVLVHVDDVQYVGEVLAAWGDHPQPLTIMIGPLFERPQDQRSNYRQALLWMNLALVPIAISVLAIRSGRD